MSEELRNAVETESWEFVDYAEIDISRDIDLAQEVAFAEVYDY